MSQKKKKKKIILEKYYNREAPDEMSFRFGFLINSGLDWLEGVDEDLSSAKSMFSVLPIKKWPILPASQIIHIFEREKVFNSYEASPRRRGL